MNKKTIWAHCVVRNEENFIWFAIKSVIDYVDKILIYDLGSTDKTVEVIKTIKSEKIILTEMEANTDMVIHANMRQRMLDENKGDWIMLLDGDEIWLDDSIRKIKKEIAENDKLESIVVPTFMLLGDVYHYQEQMGGDYIIAGKKGHYNLRAINSKIPGLHIEIYPNDQGYLREGYYDKDKKLIYHRDKDMIKVLDAPYLHASHLERSSKDEQVLERKMRFKYEVGESFGKDFKYPSCFYLDHPSIVKSPWQKMTLGYRLRAGFETPLKKIKRRLKKKFH